MKKVALLLTLILALFAAACSPTPVAAPVYTLVPTEEEPPKPAPKPTVRVQEVPKKYQVNAGDTLVGIAMAYDLDHNELARWNNLRNPDLIQVGQVLVMHPPSNDPVAATVRPQQAPVLQRATSAQLTPVTTASAADTAADTKPIQRQSTIIGAQDASPAPAPGTAPYKTEPQVIKYAYSKALLQKLQNAWQAKKNAPAAVKPKPAPAPAAKPQAKPAKAAIAAPANIASKTRQRYNIEWGLPASGAILQKYTSNSKGVDFDGKKGDPVYAAAEGVVIYVGSGVKSYGRLVILRHENNYLSAYAHNEEILVKENQQVARGTKIAVMGDSGSDRVMLHFEVRKGGKPIDPAQVLPK